MFRYGLFLGAILWLSLGYPVLAEPVLDPAAYVIEDLSGGEVRVREGEGPEWRAAQEGQVLEPGDGIRVGKDSRVTLIMRENAALHLEEGTELKVEGTSDDGQGGIRSRLSLGAGRLFAQVQGRFSHSGSSFEIEAGGVVCGSRETAFELTVGGGELLAVVHEGDVGIGIPEGSRRVPAGRAMAVKDRKFLFQREVDRSETHRHWRWLKYRQEALRKRMLRLQEIRDRVRKPWVRRHPRPEGARREGR